jgi:hypothetical protein
MSSRGGMYRLSRCVPAMMTRLFKTRSRGRRKRLISLGLSRFDPAITCAAPNRYLPRVAGAAAARGLGGSPRERADAEFIDREIDQLEKNRVSAFRIEGI